MIAEAEKRFLARITEQFVDFKKQQTIQNYKNDFHYKFKLQRNVYS